MEFIKADVKLMW